MPMNVRRAKLSAVSTSVLTLSIFVGASALQAQDSGQASDEQFRLNKAIADGRYVEAPENSRDLPEYLRPSVRLGEQKDKPVQKKATPKPETKTVETDQTANKGRYVDVDEPSKHKKEKKQAKPKTDQQDRARATARSTARTETRIKPDPKPENKKTAALDPTINADQRQTEADLAPPAPPPADPVVEAVRLRLTDSARFRNDNKDDVAALKAFYDARTKPVWVGKDGTNDAAKAIISEIQRAEDWGLDLRTFRVPNLVDSNAETGALAQFELNLARNFLRYARFARGGRTNPRKLSRILDHTPPVKDPAIVLEEIANAAAPDAYLRELHPKHEQFHLLRKALLRARGPQQPKKQRDPVVTIPRAGPTLKVGDKHTDVALLRKRLKVPVALGENPNYYDKALAKAVRKYQAKAGMRATGDLTRKTRRSLSRQASRRSTRPRGKSLERRLLINMEKWRWLAEDLGDFYVWDNLPEFTVRVMKDGKQIWREKIIIGLPEWPTPTLSSKIEHTIFYPTWGVPTGIKQRELLPRIRRAAKPQGFFDALFGGGGNSGGARVIKAYNLTVYRNGRVINPNSVDWSTANIHNYSFVQPPGGSNPLGIVKFTFPNKYTVYMHDTIEPELFARSNRMLSHGCLRVRNPRKLAELLYMHDKGVPQSQAAAAARRGQSFKLENPVPVHLTYFTAMVDDKGRVQTYSDIYGHDRRIARAVLGKNVTFRDPPPRQDTAKPVTTSRAVTKPEESTTRPRPQQPRKKKRKRKRTAKKKSKSPPQRMPSNLSEAISGRLSY